MMNPEDLKKMFGKDFDISHLTKGIESMMDKVNPMLDNVVKEHQKIIKPKAKKNLTINGISCNASLIEDGRVIINFSSIDQAQKYYDTIEKFTVQKPWYKKLFNK